jgi:signal transduction histidine kinase
MRARIAKALQSLRPTSLRARLALGVALPLLLSLAAISLIQYERQRNLLETQARHTAAQLGEVILGSLRRAMLVNDRKLLDTLVKDVGQMDALDRVLLLDHQGIIQFDSAGNQVGAAEHTEDPGCQECHAYPAASRPRAVYRTDGSGMLRVATPIQNEPACFSCHSANQAHLGILLADVPLLVWQERLVNDLETDLALSAAGTLTVTLGVYALVHRLLVRRLEQARAPLASLSRGDLSARLPTGRSQDELDRLAGAVNSMADGLARHLEEEQAHREERQRAVAHERERIARDLHDGLAQILGYVNLKAQAVRLLLARGKSEDAQVQLQQLEQAAGEVLADIRQAILGLRLSTRLDLDFAAKLRSFAEQFRGQSGVDVRLELPDETHSVHLAAGAEVELLRIVQEALANIRKHADAHSASLRLESSTDGLWLTIADDGSGFDPLQPMAADQFGLLTMRERAAAIGADLELDSGPGRGTRVTVHLAAQEE